MSLVIAREAKSRDGLNRKILFLIVLFVLWIAEYRSLQSIANVVVFDVFGLSSGGCLTETLRFFLFEAPRVMMLLLLVVFGIGIIRMYFLPKEPEVSWEGKCGLPAVPWEDARHRDAFPFLLRRPSFHWVRRNRRPARSDLLLSCIRADD